MTKLNRVLATLVVGLALLAWWVSRSDAPASDARLFVLDRETVHRLVLENARGRFVFESSEADDRWRLVEPERYPAHRLKIATLIASLESIRVDRPLPVGETAPAALTRAGLDVNAARFEITVGERVVRGRVGMPPAIGRRTPVVSERRAGVCTMTSDVAHLFHQPIDAYRAPTALVFDPTEWEGVRFDGVAFALELRNPTRNRWLLIDPATRESRPPSPAFVRKINAGVPRLAVAAWLDGDAVPSDAFPPGRIRRITVWWGEQSPLESDVLEVGVARDEATLFARRREGPVFAIRRAELEAFFPVSATSAR